MPGALNDVRGDAREWSAGWVLSSPFHSVAIPEGPVNVPPPPSSTPAVPFSSRIQVRKVRSYSCAKPHSLFLIAGEDPKKLGGDGVAASRWRRGIRRVR